MLPVNYQVNSDSDESLDCSVQKKPKISILNGHLFNRDISTDEDSQNYDEIKMANYSDLKNSDDDDDYYKYEDSNSEDNVLTSDGEIELEKYVINESNSNTSDDEKTDDECIKEVGGGANDYDNDEETKNTPYESMDIDSNEAYDLLEKVYTNKNKILNKPKTENVTRDGLIENEKIVLEEVCKNHFDILPENWFEVTHKSGMPIYFHKKSRVVTLSRPYFLGSGDCKSHLAPLSAISCLQYKKYLKNKEILKKEPDFQISKLGNMIVSNAKVETAEENIIKESLTHVELREYCQSLIKFKDKEEKSSSKTPKEQNLETKIPSSTLKNAKVRPLLPDSTKFISLPVQTDSKRHQEYILNPNGKSYVTILHEYSQNALKIQPLYEFKELTNTETPYSVTVELNDVKYGVGVGCSKKQAKLNAAKATLDILIPEIKNDINSDIKNQSDLIIFDQLKVTDHRIAEFCDKTSESSPYTILLVCLRRNFGKCKIGIEYKLRYKRRKVYQLTMTVGKHTVSVSCNNKMNGKQKAAQLILGLLHPHIDNWGSFLRLYGKQSIKSVQEKKQEQKEITNLQEKSTKNQPNFAVLNKLKEEMLKIRDQRKLKKTNEMLDDLSV